MPHFDWSNFVKIIGAIAFVAAEFLAYDDVVLFLKIHIAVLVFMGVIFIRDINVLSIIIIIGAANVCASLLYPIIMESDYQAALKLLTYGLICFTLFKLKTETHRLSISVAVGLCIAAELYWLVTDYNAPKIYLSVLLININVLVRYFMFQRVFIVSKYFPKQYRSLDLDMTIHDVVWYYVLLHMLVLLEYGVRHILKVQIQIVYDLSSYIFHGLTTFLVLLILVQGYKIIRYEWFKA
jgi:hypothetical protein